MTYNEALDFVFLYEGGYVNDPKDPGGETNWGISKRAYPKLDIKNLTRRDAKRIYRRDYWIKTRCEELPPELRLIMVDTAVNMGVDRAVKILQESLSVKIDGDFGPRTYAALMGSPTPVIVHRFALIRHRVYTGLIGWKRYSKGWSKRLLDVAVLSALMAEPSLPQTQLS